MGSVIVDKKIEGETPIVYVKQYEEPIEIEEIVQEVEWNTETIKNEIKEVFGEDTIMLSVAWCESRFDPNAYNPTNGSGDKGIFQISTKYHGHKTERLGLDMYDVEDNIEYAKMLYDEQGLKPWIWSKPCWSA